MKRHACASGFTLIEISIVLVIIGLIIGGVMVGRTMLYGAAARQAVNDYASLTSTIGAFKNKYNALPGDMANATVFFSNCAPFEWIRGNANPCNGNGDQKYDGLGENTLRVWEHLRLGGMGFKNMGTGLYDAGYMPGINIPLLAWASYATTINTSPANNSGLSWAFQYNDVCSSYGWNGCEPGQPGIIANVTGANRLVLLRLRDQGANNVFWLDGGGIDWNFARDLDQKMDDGKPMSGRMRAYDRLVGGPACTNGTLNPSQEYRSNYGGSCVVALDLPF